MCQILLGKIGVRVDGIEVKNFETLFIMRY